MAQSQPGGPGKKGASGAWGPRRLGRIVWDSARLCLCLCVCVCVCVRVRERALGGLCTTRASLQGWGRDGGGVGGSGFQAKLG